MCVTARVDEVGAVAVRRRECLKRASHDQVELDCSWVNSSVASSQTCTLETGKTGEDSDRK